MAVEVFLLLADRIVAYSGPDLVDCLQRVNLCREH